MIDTSGSIARKILLFEENRESTSEIQQGWFEAQIASGELSQLDPEIAKYCAQNIARFERLFEQKRNELYETSAIINSLELANPDKARLQLYSAATETRKEIDLATELVEDFLKFLDIHLTRKLDSK
jgi:hypothetical protein